MRSSYCTSARPPSSVGMGNLGRSGDTNGYGTLMHLRILNISFIADIALTARVVLY